ncbi:MAG TPA: ATP-binding protein [Bacillota bacterium]|nr:ATP-binding protein [Candidatus Fermentithermobacillaceae bacterium]HOB30896.1 ATP-binding protein [Bacillota bacterium]HOK64693.1 ATP-binding protein [Bacillota bacterium]HOL12176.1 ATP-binding protein [Bacillota bacterium]HOQ02214.1 ATP-binding protein [Bacillota bacterium]
MYENYLDDSWIRQGVVKRKANYSPIICFETVDPKRIYQLKSFALSDPDFAHIENIFLYDPWDGLGMLRMGSEGPRFEPIKKRIPTQTALSSRTRTEVSTDIQALKAALKEVDSYLKVSPTLFILQNLSEVREYDTGFQAALRAWAIDPYITAKGSSVMILTQDVSRLMDEFTKEFCVIIEVDPSSHDERSKLIESVAMELGVSIDGSKLEAATVAMSGLNLHQIESILLESYQRTKDFDPNVMKELKSEMVKRSKILEVRDPQYTFGDIGGYHAIKDFIIKYMINVLKRPERARHFGLGLPKGLLFFGPPGTGKSLFANALASEVQLPFINLVTENIYSKWLGESGQNMKNAITLAEKMSPAIVFVDEIDRFGKRTGAAAGSAEEETQRVFSQFLEWLGMPDRSAIIVGTTNVPEHLDDAFLRAGRFDYKIPFLYPGPQARHEILMVHLGLTEGSSKKRAPLEIGEDEIGDFLWEEIVPLTHNFSCAELEELIIRSKRIAFDKEKDAIGKQEILQATKTFRIDSSYRKHVVEMCMQQARRFTDDQSFLDAIEEENRMYENSRKSSLAR